MIDRSATIEGWQTALDEMNRLGEKLKMNGLGFAYHNQMLEFVAKPGGISSYDRLLSGTDPELVKIELELYWAVRAGVDVPALIERLGGRIYAYHVRDMRENRRMAAVGQGTLDFTKLFEHSKGSAHYYVENDETPPPYIPDITASFEALRALRF